MQDPWINPAYKGARVEVTAKQGASISIQRIDEVLRVGVLQQDTSRHLSCAMTPEQVRALRDALSEMLVEIEKT